MSSRPIAERSLLANTAVGRWSRSARIHQHVDIGQGEVDWDEFFSTLRELSFDGIATVCVFAWEERAVESSRYMFARVTKELAG